MAFCFLQIQEKEKEERSGVEISFEAIYY